MDPVIVIGMHRSGTSMLTRILEDCGLFVGNKLEGNHEATFFLALDRFVYKNACAGWTRPWPVLDLIDHPEGRDMMVDYLRNSCASPRAKEFTGRRGGSKRIFGLDEPWGWKDPRTTVTLPLWLDIWPDAPIVQVDRHGVDVARSLQVRYEKAWENSKLWYERKKPMHRLKAAQKPFSRGHRIRTIDGGIGMWDDHMQIAQQHTKDLGAQLHRFRYEDFLAKPMDFMPKLLAHCGLDPSDEQIAAAIDGVNPSRAFAYRKNPELVEAARRHQKTLARHGYA